MDKHLILDGDLKFLSLEVIYPTLSPKLRSELTAGLVRMAEETGEPCFAKKLERVQAMEARIAS